MAVFDRDRVTELVSSSLELVEDKEPAEETAALRRAGFTEETSTGAAATWAPPALVSPPRSPSQLWSRGRAGADPRPAHQVEVVPSVAVV
jgi:hypothetical protein